MRKPRQDITAQDCKDLIKRFEEACAFPRKHQARFLIAEKLGVEPPTVDQWRYGLSRPAKYAHRRWLVRLVKQAEMKRFVRRYTS